MRPLATTTCTLTCLPVESHTEPSHAPALYDVIGVVALLGTTHLRTRHPRCGYRMSTVCISILLLLFLTSIIIIIVIIKKYQDPPYIL